MEIWQLPLLFLAGGVAGFVDSVAGGGGMITLPVLLSLGLPPQAALATNKLQAVFGSATAAAHYSKAGAAEPRQRLLGFACSFAGAILGTLAVRQMAPAFLRIAIPVLLIGVATYLLVHPHAGERDVHRRMSPIAFDIVFGLGIGFYDGFFGPGTGTFWTMSFMVMLGFNMVRATGNAKIMNFGSNIASLACFTLAGQVLLLPGLLMGTGQLVGARIGSGMVIKRGTRFIRPVFLSMVLLIALRLLWTTLKTR